MANMKKQSHVINHTKKSQYSLRYDFYISMNKFQLYFSERCFISISNRLDVRAINDLQYMW